MRFKRNPIAIEDITADSLVFKNAKGKSCAAGRSASFEIYLKRRKRPIVGEFPPGTRRSKKTRADYLLKVLAEVYRQARKKREARAKRKREKELQLERDRLLAKKRRRKKQIEAAKEEERPLPPSKPLVPKPKLSDPLPSLRGRLSKDGEIITGRKIVRPESERTGITRYQDRQMQIRTLDLSFKEPVQIDPHRKDQQMAVIMERFEKRAAKFVEDHKGISNMDFICRIKTSHTVMGRDQGHMGIGTERVHLRGKNDLKDWLYNAEYGLLGYFHEKTNAYLTRQTGESFAITGFTMEVVLKVQ